MGRDPRLVLVDSLLVRFDSPQAELERVSIGDVHHLSNRASRSWVAVTPGTYLSYRAPLASEWVMRRRPSEVGQSNWP